MPQIMDAWPVLIARLAVNQSGRPPKGTNGYTVINKRSASDRRRGRLGRSDITLSRMEA